MIPQWVRLVDMYDGYLTIIDGVEYKLKYGSIIIRLAEVNVDDIKKKILECPYFHDTPSSSWSGYKSLFRWLYGNGLGVADPIAASILTSEIAGFINTRFRDYDFSDYGESEENDNLAIKLKKAIFGETDYCSYGKKTIGQFLLSALCDTAYGLEVIKGSVWVISNRGKSVIERGLAQGVWEKVTVECQFDFLDDVVRTAYIVKSSPGVLMLEMTKIFEKNIAIRRCQNCGKYFVPESRSDEIYCGRISPQAPEMTCKKYGSKKLWYDKLKEDEVAKLSRNIYMAKQMLVKRNPDRPEYKEMLDFFKAERKKWQAQLKTGKKTAEEYTAWLNQMKAQKVLHSKNKPMEEV